MDKIRITGFGAGNALVSGSAQWEYVTSNKELARRVIVFLEDRRVLTQPHETREDAEYCRRSADKIRKFLTLEIMNVKAGGPLEKSLKQIRAASTAFTSAAGPKARDFVGDQPLFLAHLLAFRDVVGFEIRSMIEIFGVDVSPELMDIVPQQDLSWLPNSET